MADDVFSQTILWLYSQYRATSAENSPLYPSFPDMQHSHAHICLKRQKAGQLHCKKTSEKAKISGHSSQLHALTEDLCLNSRLLSAFSLLKRLSGESPSGTFGMQERDVPYSYFCSVPTSWEVLPPPFTYRKPDLLTAICKVFKQNRELSPTEISRTHFLLSFCTSFFLSSYHHFRRYTDIGIPPKRFFFFSWETMKISKGWEQKDLRPLPCFCSFPFADWRQVASYTLHEHRDGAENQSTGERNTISVPSEALRMKYSNRVTMKMLKKWWQTKWKLSLGNC